MSLTAPYMSIYGHLTGHAEVEAAVLSTLGTWIVTYVAEYERQRRIPPRQLPIPPVPESIHGGVDFQTFNSGLMPELIAVVQPTGEAERLDPGVYGQWWAVSVSAFLYVEGSQDLTRQLAGAYGAVLQGLIAQQGGLGYVTSSGGYSPVPVTGAEPFAVRTRLRSASALEFPDESVRDVMRATVSASTFVASLVDDLAGPLVPPTDPYAYPLGWPTANRVEIALVDDPDAQGRTGAYAVVDDGTVNPSVIRYEEVQVDVPTD